MRRQLAASLDCDVTCRYRYQPAEAVGTDELAREREREVREREGVGGGAGVE